jgi:hypothetical protein
MPHACGRGLAVPVAARSDPGRYFSIASSQIVPCGYVENFRQAALDAALTAATDLRWPPASTALARLPLSGRSASCSPGPGPLADCVSGPQCPAGRHRPRGLRLPDGVDYLCACRAAADRSSPIAHNRRGRRGRDPAVDGSGVHGGCGRFLGNWRSRWGTLGPWSQGRRTAVVGSPN